MGATYAWTGGPGFAHSAAAKAGVKNQPVTATFADAPTARAGSKLPAFVLFGVAGASLLTFGGLAIAGQVEFDGFDACKPRCDPDDVDRVEREFIAASAVSKRLSDLETAVDTALLYRHSRGVTLTPAGESLLHHARTVGLPALMALDFQERAQRLKALAKYLTERKEALYAVSAHTGATRADGSWTQTLGQVSGRVFAGASNAPGADAAARLRLRIMHPMDTGLANGIPAFYISRLSVRDAGNRELLRIQTFEPVSENPVFSFDFAKAPPGPLRITGVDNNGNRIDSKVD